jgi:uncharacterized membrane protein YfcA
VELSVLLVGGLAVLLSAFVQGTVGLGLSLVAVPVVALLDPSLLPGSTLLLGAAMPAMTMLHEWRHVSWSDAGWLTGARLVTTPLGVLVVSWLSAETIGIAVGIGVLLAVALTAWKFDVRASRPNLALAGAVAGVSSTAAGIAGPPAAIVLQREQGSRLRATLAAFFLIGATSSLVALAVGGQLTERQLGYGAGWIPFVAAGFGLAIPLQNRLPAHLLRSSVLVLSAVSAVAVLLRSLF